MLLTSAPRVSRDSWRRPRQGRGRSAACQARQPGRAHSMRLPSCRPIRRSACRIQAAPMGRPQMGAALLLPRSPVRQPGTGTVPAAPLRMPHMRRRQGGMGRMASPPVCSRTLRQEDTRARRIMVRPWWPPPLLRVPGRPRLRRYRRRRCLWTSGGPRPVRSRGSGSSKDWVLRRAVLPDCHSRGVLRACSLHGARIAHCL